MNKLVKVRNYLLAGTICCLIAVIATVDIRALVKMDCETYFMYHTKFSIIFSMSVFFVALLVTVALTLYIRKKKKESGSNQ